MTSAFTGAGRVSVWNCGDRFMVVFCRDSLDTELLLLVTGTGIADFFTFAFDLVLRFILLLTVRIVNEY